MSWTKIWGVGDKTGKKRRKFSKRNSVDTKGFKFNKTFTKKMLESELDRKFKK